MYITKTLAFPHLDESDHLKIVKLEEGEPTLLYSVLRELMWMDDYDLSDDEILAHLCIHQNLFTYRDWQNSIQEHIDKVLAIDYVVDPTKRRLDLVETVYYSSGCTGRVTGNCYKMLSSLCARDLVFQHKEEFRRLFGKEIREYVEDLWVEMDNMLKAGIIKGEYTNELTSIKFHIEK
jgi:hypothetical protein